MPVWYESHSRNNIFYLLFFLPLLRAPPCLSTKPIKGSRVLVRSLEQARGGVSPGDRSDDFIPELDARAWGDEWEEEGGEEGMKAERWMQQSPESVPKSSGYKAPPPSPNLQGRMTSGHPLLLLLHLLPLLHSLPGCPLYLIWSVLLLKSSQVCYMWEYE